MAYLTYRNGIKAFYTSLFLTTLFAPDVIFGLLLGFLHLLLELIHILFEFVEMALDSLVEHVFHTGLHETQIIVFYILCTIGLGLLYFLKRALPRYCRRLHEAVRVTWVSTKARLAATWTNGSRVQKT